MHPLTQQQQPIPKSGVINIRQTGYLNLKPLAQKKGEKERRNFNDLS